MESNEAVNEIRAGRVACPDFPSDLIARGRDVVVDAPGSLRPERPDYRCVRVIGEVHKPISVSPITAEVRRDFKIVQLIEPVRGIAARSVVHFALEDECLRLAQLELDRLVSVAARAVPAPVPLHGEP